MSVADKTAQTSASPEDRSGSIRLVGARVHNLRDVSLSIPKDRVTAFVGVSGSGKSSVVFDTIAVEAQRQLYATFPPSSAINCPGTNCPMWTPSRTCLPLWWSTSGR